MGNQNFRFTDAKNMMSIMFKNSTRDNNGINVSVNP